MPFSLGIKRLSQMVIDAVKDWGGKRIDNVGAPNTDDDVPRARAGDVLSGRFGLARMPDMALNKIMVGQGPGSSPVEQDKPAAPYTQGAKAYVSGSVSIPNAEWTLVGLNAESYDTDNIHDNTTNNSRLTCKTAGKYVITGEVEWSTNTSGKRWVNIYRNGGFLTMDIRGPAAGGYCAHILATIDNLAVNDYVEIAVFQDSGSTLTVANMSHLEMQRIG